MTITANQKKRLPYRIMKDGREICSTTKAGLAEYQRRRRQMWMRDKARCCLCGKWIIEGYETFEHISGRGMGGSKRDDRIRFNGVSHFHGNSARGSMNYERYMEIPLEIRIQNCRGVQ